MKVGGEPAVAHIADHLLITVHIADSAAVDHIVEAELSAIDGGGDGSDGLHIGFAHLRIVDELL